MKNYVLGFVTDAELRRVLLIEKNRPAFLKGLWNGVGGKVEAGETPCQAMVRETQEETGLSSTTQDWRELGEITGADFRVLVYFSSTLCLEKARSCEDEVVNIFLFDDVATLPLAPNVRECVESIDISQRR